MKTKGFFIQLDNPVRSFFPGQTISGRVIVQNDRPKDLKNISITFEGVARVHWTETRTESTGTGNNKRNVTVTDHYVAKEEYFTCKIMLFGNDQSTLTLPTGTLTYPFIFTLPSNLPSSYTSSIGMVHYLMEAKMKRPWLKSDLKAIVPFTVNGILDLNMEPGVAQSVLTEKTKSVCCLCCKSGPVGYKIALQRTGFVPGEFAQFNAEFTNHSRRKVTGVSVTLIQIANFHAQGRTKTIRRDIASVMSPQIPPGESDMWGGNVLRIPPVPPTRLANCRIIDVQYVLRFEMHISGITINMKAEIPITIGTIPFRNMFNEFTPSGWVSPPQSNDLSVPGFSGNAMPQMPPITPTAPVFDTYPDLPPPSYAEAMQAEMFSYQPEPENASKGKINPGFEGGHGHDPDLDQDQHPTAEPSAPREYDYVPNYLTYGYSKQS